jgi:hypothetical protein
MVNSKAISLLIGGGSLALVAAVAVWASAEHTSPGQLHASHAQVRELRGSKNCAACHSSGSETMADACTACHQPISQQIESNGGMHGILDKKIALACEQCHREHVDGAIALVSDQSFQRAGVPDLQGFDHDLTGGFGLDGKHLSLECQKCHQNAHAVVLPKGQKRFIGLERDCASCHSDPHDNTLPDCASCHGQEHPFELAVGFSHEGFDLVGGHDVSDCAACHQGQLFSEAPTDCYSCHVTDYRATTDPNHIAARIGTACQDCHSVDMWEGAPFEHVAEFPLVTAHAESRCIDCHESGYAAVHDSVETGAENLLSVGAVRTCAACHTSPHAPDFEVRVADLLGVSGREETCQSCHDPDHRTFSSQATRIADAGDDAFASPSPQMLGGLHAATGFLLESPHDGLVCAQCHSGYGSIGDLTNPPAHPEWSMRFPGRHADACQACHDNPHGLQFADSSTAGKCLACHDQHQFTPSRFDAEMHESCDFPLTDSHRAVACASCHQVTGGTPQFVPTPTACAACHTDVHEGRFDRPGLPTQVNGETGCVRCHTGSNFHDVTWAQPEHQRWTDYELTGAHAAAACRDCHTRSGAKGIVDNFVRLDTACAVCHTDPHLGQFKKDNANDCQQCHQSTTSFTNLVFDHDRDARFALDEHHRTLDCISCHKATPSPNGDVIRYRPLGIECADCHGSFGESGGGR